MDGNRLKEVWQALDDRLAGIDFEAIWPGFSPVDFALYTPLIMCFKGQISDKPASFMGNTALEYEGSCIAIWDMSYTILEDGESLDRLAANLVHEMFHAFQHRQGDRRFAKDLELLLYPRDHTLTAWTARESGILAESALYQGEGLKERALESLSLVAAIREQKMRLSGGAAINEFRVETTEGLAEYAGYRSLCQLDAKLAAGQLTRYRDQLIKGDYLFDIRRRCYFSGILLAVTVDKAGLPVAHDLRSEKTFWELLDVLPEPLEPLSAEELLLAASLTAVERERRAILLADFRRRFPQKRPLKATIVGYDPMNLTRIDDFLISTHILMTEEGGSRETFTGPHLFLMEAGEEQRVEAVFFERP